jgi:hypothetical protein
VRFSALTVVLISHQLRNFEPWEDVEPFEWQTDEYWRLTLSLRSEFALQLILYSLGPIVVERRRSVLAFFTGQSCPSDGCFVIRGHRQFLSRSKVLL